MDEDDVHDVADFSATAQAQYEGILSTLQEEHLEMARLLAVLEAMAKDDKEDERAELFETIQLELLAHAYAEHATFYSVLATRAEASDAIAESKRENAELENNLYALGIADIGSADWADRLRDLVRAVERHVELEEGVLFPAARTIFDISACSAPDDEFRSETDAEIARLQTNLADFGATPLGE